MSARFSGINEIRAVIDRPFYVVVACQPRMFKPALFRLFRSLING
jgi:hypothetical protein